MTLPENKTKRRIWQCGCLEHGGRLATDAGAVDIIEAENERLEAENKRLRENALEVFKEESRLLRVEYSPSEGMEVVVASPFWGILAEMIQADFDEYGAENYIEHTMELRAEGFTLSFLITVVKRPHGMTPGQKAMTLEIENKRLQTIIDGSLIEAEAAEPAEPEAEEPAPDPVEYCPTDCPYLIQHGPTACRCTVYDRKIGYPDPNVPPVGCSYHVDHGPTLDIEKGK